MIAGKLAGKIISNQKAERMKTYYVIVDVEDKRLGAYVPAENVEGGVTTATARYKMDHPRLHVETIAVQEMTNRYVDPAFVSLRQSLRLEIND